VGQIKRGQCGFFSL